MYNPRKDRITRLKKKLDRITNALKSREYRATSDMLSDLAQFSRIELEIEIQTAYLQQEER